MKNSLNLRKFSLNKSLRSWRWFLYSKSGMRRWIERRLDLSRANWLFLLGLNNSGTTLISRVLARHESISWMGGEGQFHSSEFLLPHDVPAWSPAHEPSIRRIFTEREELFRWTEGGGPDISLRVMYDWSYYLSKNMYLFEGGSPTNTLRSRGLQHHFSPSFFVAVIRNPYAVCEGIRRRDGYSIARAARHWTRGNQILLEDAAYLKNIITIKYEDFCDRPDEVLAAIARFLGLDESFESTVKSEQFDVHNIDSDTSPIKNMNRRSLERLSIEDFDEVNRIAAPLMERLRYEVLGSPVETCRGADRIRDRRASDAGGWGN